MEKAPFRLRLTQLAPISTETSAVVVSHLFAWLSQRVPGTVTFYRAMPDEVDVSQLVDRLPGWRWVLPRVESDLELTWRDGRLPLERHKWGMEQPVASGPVVPTHEIDIFLVPGVAFDRTGNRLGRGGGFYDRELASMRGDALPVGVTVDERVLDAVPFEEHDIRVRYLSTETGVIETSARI